jgi:putative chitinase
MPEQLYLSSNVLALFKGCIANKIVYQLPSIAAITNPLRLAHFLAQCAHESGHFNRTIENLNYSDVNRIVKIFRHDCDLDHDRVIEPHEIEAAKKYVKNPQALANFVYANQNGNGDEASGDGYTFRGRGYIQLTGKSNYARFGEFVGADTVSNPDLVASQYPLASAGFYFDLNDIWSVCDRGSSGDVITAVTKKVNGGKNGLPERTKLFNDYYALLQQ